MKTLILASILSLLSFSALADLAPLKTAVLKDGRTIVVDAEGFAVYTFDVDPDGESRCYDACAAAWPAITVANGTQVSAPVGLTTRQNGALQLTVNGRPVYYFENDANPGDIKGEGLGGVWHLIVQ